MGIVAPRVRPSRKQDFAYERLFRAGIQETMKHQALGECCRGCLGFPPSRRVAKGLAAIVRAGREPQRHLDRQSFKILRISDPRHSPCSHRPGLKGVISFYLSLIAYVPKRFAIELQAYIYSELELEPTRLLKPRPRSPFFQLKPLDQTYHQHVIQDPPRLGNRRHRRPRRTWTFGLAQTRRWQLE